MAAEILELPSRRRRMGRLRPRSSLGASHFSSISPPLPAPGASQMLHLPLPNLHLALISACGAAPRRLLPLPARGKPLRRRCHARAKDAVMLRGAHGDAEGQEGADPQERASQGELEPFHASLILFLGRAWDAVTDPAVGFLVSKSPRRKFGKLIPWIACSTPFGVLCYCLLWSTLADGAPASLKFLWYLFTYNFFQICMTCYHVPYSSLTMFLGGTQRDRDSATAYRMGLEVFSTLLGSGIQGQMVGASHGRLTHGCSLGNGTLPNSSTPSLAGWLEGTSLRVCLPGAGLHLLPLLSGSGFRGQGAAGAPQPPGEGWAALHPLPEDDRGTQTLHPAALWLPLRLPGLPGHAGDFCFLLYPRCGAGREIPAFGARHAGHGFPLYPLLAVVFGEIWEENGSDGGPGGEFAPGCGCGLRSHALATRGGNKKVDRVAHQAQQWQEASCSSGTSQLLPGSAGKGQHSLQFGRAKRAAESARVLLFLLFLSLPQLIIPALVAITQVSHNFLAFVLLMMVAGCSMAVLYLLPWSMLPDAVDDFMLRNPSCLNLEALFYSFYVFFNKFAGGLAVGISTLGLHFAGYRAGDCTYNPSVTLALKLLMAPVPITLLLIAITLFCLHPINEERRKQMRTELEAMGRRQARHGSSEHHQG
eukprot:XP_027329046.1 uncharacterized protein LOC101804470 isoform X3 [Anas platyrhynchos]